MRKNFILLFFLLTLTQVAMAQDTILNGDIKQYDDNGKIKSEKNYINGQLNGPFREYYPNGNLMSVGSYKNEQLQGAYKSYYEDGSEYFEKN